MCVSVPSRPSTREQARAHFQRAKGKNGGRWRACDHQTTIDRRWPKKRESDPPPFLRGVRHLSHTAHQLISLPILDRLDIKCSDNFPNSLLSLGCPTDLTTPLHSTPPHQIRASTFLDLLIDRHSLYASLSTTETTTTAQIVLASLFEFNQREGTQSPSTSTTATTTHQHA